MNILFKSVNDAKQYYYKYNDSSFEISDENGQWTKPIKYNKQIVRYNITKYNNEHLSFEPFNINDIPQPKTLLYETMGIHFKHVPPGKRL
jgi:hypothetical protein